MNEQSETERSSTDEHWFGHDRLRLSEGDNAIDITIGSESHWDRSHLRRLRQSGDLPGMVPIIDSDFSADGKPFAVTPVVAAPTLAALVAAGDLTWETGAAISEAAARAAHEAHLRGLFHGGLNADDVYLIDNDVAIAGVGLGLGGTPPQERLPWVAPEVRDGAEPTERSDVYSLGKVLEFSLSDSLDTVPRSIRRLIMWSSSDTPEARPPSALEFASILAEGLGEDRLTYGPAFIPTAGTADLASHASSAVSNHTPTETAQNTATAAGAGLFGAGAAAVGANALLSDREPEGLDDGVVASDGPLEEAAGDVDPGLDLDETIDISSEQVPTVEEEPTVEAVHAVDPGFAAEQAPAGFSDTDDATGELQLDPSVATPAEEPMDMSPIAAETVDLDESYVPRQRRNRAGVLIGAILVLGLGLIAWGLITAGGDDDDVAADGDATSVASTTEGTSADEAATDGTATETDAATTASTEAATTTEAPATTAAPATEQVETADESSLVPMADGPIDASDAGIQLLHGVPGAEVDVYVNGTAIATGFESGTIAGPIAMSPGDYEVALYPATDLPPADMANRTDEALYTQMVPVGGSAASVVAHLDSNGDVTISPFLEQLSAVDPGQSRIMIRHLMATGDAEATIDGEVIGSLAPGEEAALEVDAGSIEIEIVGADGGVLAAATVAVNDGELVSLSAIGVPGTSAELVVQRYAGLSTAPAAVPTGNSGLLDGGSDDVGIRLSYGLMVVFVLSGTVVVFRRRRTAH